MAVLVSDLIEQTKRYLYGSSRLELNRLNAAITSSQTSFTLEFELQGAVRGAILSVENELMYVFSAVTGSKTVTVQRGYLGSTAASHAISTIVEVNPRFPRVYISDALKQEINSWAPRLYKVSAQNISISSTTSAYDLTGITDFLHVVDVRASPHTGRTTRPMVSRWSVSRDLDVGDFASGAALQILSVVPSTGTFRVRVAQAFSVTTWAEDTDVEATVGLASSMVDIPPYGAAWRLMSGREIPRTSTAAQPEPRRAEEVPPGHLLNTATQLKQLRDVRISEEIIRLREKYPVRGVA